MWPYSRRFTSGTATDSLSAWCARYENTSACHRGLLREFHERVADVPWLAAHRDFVERQRLGYGCRAFHFLFYLLLRDLGARFAPVSMLEIGVYKGQMTSLAALAGERLGFQTRITALSPFQGNAPATRILVSALRYLCDPQLRAQHRLGNLHPAGDYLADNQRLFAEFALDFAAVELVRGLSTDPALIQRVSAERFGLVFIDGDHSYEVASSDIRHFAPLTEPGGFLVVDDAGCDLRGFGYDKGLPSVSRACLWLETAAGWKNSLNVGKMRVFQRLG